MRHGMATLSLSPLPPPASSSIFIPKPSTFFNTPQSHNVISLPFTRSSCLSSTKPIVHFHLSSLQLSSKRYNKLWRTNATSELTTPLETSQQIVSSSSSSGDTATTVISVLLFIAFVALSILTIGVIYIGVTDFLQKREREKFEKEEATKKRKKGGKKTQVRARAGPRGFGQKIDDEDDDDVV